MAASPETGKSRGAAEKTSGGSSHSPGDEVISPDESTKRHLSAPRKKGRKRIFNYEGTKGPGNSPGLKRLAGWCIADTSGGREGEGWVRRREWWCHEKIFKLNFGISTLV